MRLYAYCLAEGPPPLPPAVSGIGGATPRVLSLDVGVVGVVSDFPEERAAVSPENVLAHERVVAHVLASTTPLPLRFGAVVSPARLESYVGSHRDALRAAFERVRGCVEMSVKVIWDAADLGAVGGAAGDAGPESGPATGPGAAFLEAKRRQILGDETRRERADAVAGWLLARLGHVVRESAVHTRPQEALFLAGAYLVERAQLGEYRERLRGACAERPDLRFLASGPWPPYSFSQAGP